MDTMKLSIDNYKNILPGNLVKRSEKCIARECDEIEKYKYQAYVDENDVSFDVTILLNDKKELLHHDCDCGIKAVCCQHKIALFSYIAKKGAKKSAGNPKKSQPTQTCPCTYSALLQPEVTKGYLFWY